MTLSQTIARGLLKCAGWRILGQKPQDAKYVFIVAPHTSNWDFIIGKLGAMALGIQLKIAIKASWFFPPMGWILKSLGAMPVDRKNAGGFLKQMIQAYKNKQTFVFTVTPEGTRSFVKYWKAGFYTIAMAAEVPIVLAKLDFGKKEVGVIARIQPCGDIEKDFETIMTHYQEVEARYPEKFNKDAKIRKK